MCKGNAINTLRFATKDFNINSVNFIYFILLKVFSVSQKQTFIKLTAKRVKTKGI